MSWAMQSAMTKTNEARKISGADCEKRSQWLAVKALESKLRRHHGSFRSERPGSELLLMFGVIGDALLDLAVTHELGHAICHDQDERRADDYGRGLREKKPVACGKGPGIGAARASTRK